MSPLLRHPDEIEPEITALICHDCRHRHTRAETLDFGLLGDPLLCLECGEGGLIPSTGTRLEERFPAGLTAWIPVPAALLERREELGLRPADLLVIVALEKHRRTAGDRVFPSRGLIARHTGVSDASVKRSIRHLTRAGLLVSEPRFTDRGDQTSNAYVLDPLWQRLVIPPGQCDPGGANDGSETTEIGSAEATKGHSDPGAPGHADPPPGSDRPTEVEVVEVEAVPEEDPEGPSLPPSGSEPDGDVDQSGAPGPGREGQGGLVDLPLEDPDENLATPFDDPAADERPAIEEEVPTNVFDAPCGCGCGLMLASHRAGVRWLVARGERAFADELGLEATDIQALTVEELLDA